MRDTNVNIELTFEEAVAILSELEVVLLSLHKIGSYYADKNNSTEYAIETNRFIDDWRITQRLAKARSILTEKFDLTLGDDDMDDLERALEDIPTWSPSNRIAPKSKDSE